MHHKILFLIAVLVQFGIAQRQGITLPPCAQKCIAEKFDNSRKQGCKEGDKVCECPTAHVDNAISKDRGRACSVGRLMFVLTNRSCADDTANLDTGGHSFVDESANGVHLAFSQSSPKPTAPADPLPSDSESPSTTSPNPPTLPSHIFTAAASGSTPAATTSSPRSLTTETYNPNPQNNIPTSSKFPQPSPSPTSTPETPSLRAKLGIAISVPCAFALIVGIAGACMYRTRKKKATAAEPKSKSIPEASETERKKTNEEVVSEIDGRMVNVSELGTPANRYELP
ncbi:hypothetical protein K458DRAFT_492752 [Lentithecium fluviatile CBS 122367]|uniref:CFEM domain-containing protein n=1 Tax=Lentithecium fluviatile CBS 122367 TaxID=1168545 RepID=A0A6G1ICQ3_9PLEO|nr:hypothetical protein K458DRAFT_492752 [Lentithecium fluviatile CBS 122367]